MFCDRKGVGQQLAARAGEKWKMKSKAKLTWLTGYPIITIPAGLDQKGLPVSLSIQHKAWREADLVKWASAIEDLIQHEIGGRSIPTFTNFNAKNVPVLGASE